MLRQLRADGYDDLVVLSVMRDGQIRIVGDAAADRLTAVTTAATADQPIVERIVAPGPAAVPVVREVDVVTTAGAQAGRVNARSMSGQRSVEVGPDLPPAAGGRAGPA